jgi:predicted ArsR family transcriptional regulator
MKMANKKQGKANDKKATSKATQKPKNGKPSFTDDQIIAALTAVGHPAVSREVSDKLGIADPDQGRSFVRSHMKALQKDGKVKFVKPTGKTKATWLYALPSWNDAQPGQKSEQTTA